MLVQMLRLLSRVPRTSLRSLGVVHDVVAVALSFTLALGLAWGIEPLLTMWQLWAMTAAFTCLSAALFPLFSLNRGAWRYASLLDVLSIVKAVTVVCVIFLLGNFLLFRGAYLPRSTMVIAWFVMIVALGGPRLAYRLYKEKGTFRIDDREESAGGHYDNVLLFGFNDQADLFIRNQRRGHLRNRIIGIIDERPKNRRRQLHGTSVLGALRDLGTIVDRAVLAATPITQIIVTASDVSAADLAMVVERAAPLRISVKRLPNIAQTGAVDVGAPIEPLPLSLADLLGRKEINLDIRDVAKLINDRCVLVTGAGGSIGSELVRQIAQFAPRTLVLIDNSEFNLYSITRQIAECAPSITTVSRIVDVRQNDRLRRVFERYQPDVIFHAAALKHVPIVEENPLEGIETNLIGTRNVADAALHVGAVAMVMVSTDKAVSPTNIMGATKRAAEAYCQSLDLSRSGTRFLTVRFGNVLGSTGSVVPLFQAQIARGGPLTVTHPNITRYFMTIPEASRLILHAAGHGVSDRSAEGQIFVLDMGEPIRITELAERLIQLAGLQPHVDIKIEYVGLRKGEKLYEELFSSGEAVEDTGKAGLLVARTRVSDPALLRRNLDAIAVATANGDAERAVELLRHIVPEYSRPLRDTLPISPLQISAPEMGDR
ncbi:polysaccharide biosynthesis protein CapD [Aureimonas sp. SA4125]|uniref:polysaccharide biosynthesis protein n=1 Tax=Aureimonas sp. SA4125 TaxID=2826993 RepID=UPI001CC43573|nr:nucleoside-diphosphate sugar epimerase/dehydratase [Aureimonas sp. SA4125]BDA83529.1 polysaccharide biosynthesis protein CapD [Aureimonas sp. SA4125]